MKRFLAPVIWVVVFLVISFGIGQFTSANMDWYDGLNKSALTPPGIAFPIAWTTLYILLAVCGWLVWGARKGPRGGLVLALYWGVMLLNWAWSFIFFELQMVGFGFAWIMALNLANISFILAAWRNHRVPAYLVVPHLFWCAFASYLNYAVWALN